MPGMKINGKQYLGIKELPSYQTKKPRFVRAWLALTWFFGGFCACVFCFCCLFASDCFCLSVSVWAPSLCLGGRNKGSSPPRSEAFSGFQLGCWWTSFAFRVAFPFPTAISKRLQLLECWGTLQNVHFPTPFLCLLYPPGQHGSSQKAIESSKF